MLSVRLDPFQEGFFLCWAVGRRHQRGYKPQAMKLNKAPTAFRLSPPPPSPPPPSPPSLPFLQRDIQAT